MAKKQHSDMDMMQRVKLARLEKHLAEVEKLIGNWIKELPAREPFEYVNRTWGWREVYRASLAQDPDTNHMLRQHLRSRPLWKHHTEWELKLDQIWVILPAVRDRAQKEMQKMLRDGDSYTTDFMDSALYQAFHIAWDRPILLEYSFNDPKPGARFGGYVIERNASKKAELQVITEAHGGLVDRLAKTRKMHQIADLWTEVTQVEAAMQSLAGKILKANEHLHHCGFCRKLWKA